MSQICFNLNLVRQRLVRANLRFAVRIEVVNPFQWMYCLSTVSMCSKQRFEMREQQWALKSPCVSKHKKTLFYIQSIILGVSLEKETTEERLHPGLLFLFKMFFLHLCLSN